jgi:NAD(P)H-nitrite reductase large subunit
LYKRAKIRQIGTEENKVKEVLLDTGEAISCQLVGVAIGLRPNIDMVRWSGIQIRGMIFVNRKMETNIPKIFAAGDVALCYEIPGEASRCLPRWYRAWKQGEVAGLNMVGIGTEYQEIPICETSTKIADIPLLCLGNPNPSESGVKIFSGKDQDKAIYKKIALKDNQIEGALLIGDVGGAAKVAQLMNKGPSITASEQTVLEELVSVSGAEPAKAITICPICKMEINSGGCPACSQ